MVNCSFLLRRAMELNYEFNPHQPTVVRHTGSYDSGLFKEIENENDLRTEVLYELGNCNINTAILKFDSYLHDDTHKRSKIKLPRREHKSSVRHGNSKLGI